MNEHEQSDSDNKCTIQTNIQFDINKRRNSINCVKIQFHAFFSSHILSVCLIHDEMQTSVHCALNQLTLAPLLNKFLIKKYRTHVFVLSNGSDISCVGEEPEYNELNAPLSAQWQHIYLIIRIQCLFVFARDSHSNRTIFITSIAYFIGFNRKAINVCSFLTLLLLPLLSLSLLLHSSFDSLCVFFSLIHPLICFVHCVFRR